MVLEHHVVVYCLNLNYCHCLCCSLCCYLSYHNSFLGLCLHSNSHFLHKGHYLFSCCNSHLFPLSLYLLCCNLYLRCLIIQCWACLIMPLHFQKLQRKYIFLHLSLFSISTLHLPNCVIVMQLYVLSLVPSLLLPVDLLLH